MNEVWHGDCLELMKDIPDHSIDMIFCDLPYGVTNCAWDSIIDMQELWKHYKRIIKPGKPIVLTASQPFTSALVMSNPKWFRCEWIWQKPNGTNFLNAKKHPMKVHESVLVFYEKFTIYNPQMVKGGKTLRIKDGERVVGNMPLGISKRTNYINVTGLRYPQSIQKFNAETGLHATQKPIQLIEYFIRTYSNEDDLILDNCAGSGSTAIACIKTKRNYIMIEKESNYADIINERIKNYVSSPPKVKLIKRDNKNNLHQLSWI